MSDDRLDLRDLPSMPLLEEPPERFSQTLMSKGDRCPRAAYLYLKYRGGAASMEMNRGTGFHLVAERFMLDLIRGGEKSMVAAQAPSVEAGVEGEEEALAARHVASLTAALVKEVLAEHPDLVVPEPARDEIRAMAYHLALGNEIDPQTVVAVERKFVLDLACGWTVSGKIDVAALPERDKQLAEVRDYKTTFDVPQQQEFEGSYQVPLYGVLLVFGVPVEDRPCEVCRGGGMVGGEQYVACGACGGRGKVEVRLDPIGQHIQRVDGGEIYPRFLRQDGTLEKRTKVWTRTELSDFRDGMEDTALKLEHGLKTGKWPALHGDHCSECPCEPECPLPAHLRRYAGSVQTAEQAIEAMAWLQRSKKRASFTEAELKRWIREHGPIPVQSGEEVYAFVRREGRAVRKVRGRSDWEGLVAAIEMAAQFGEPFDASEWIKPTSSSQLKLVHPRELEPEVTRGAGDGSRFGDDAPF